MDIIAQIQREVAEIRQALETRLSALEKAAHAPVDMSALIRAHLIVDRISPRKITPAEYVDACVWIGADPASYFIDQTAPEAPAVAAPKVEIVYRTGIEAARQAYTEAQSAIVGAHPPQQDDERRRWVGYHTIDSATARGLDMGWGSSLWIDGQLFGIIAVYPNEKGTDYVVVSVEFPCGH